VSKKLYEIIRCPGERFQPNIPVNTIIMSISNSVKILIFMVLLPTSWEKRFIELLEFIGLQKLIAVSKKQFSFLDCRLLGNLN
jgi:hypothetical protein